MPGVEKTKTATSSMIKKVIQMQEAGDAPLNEGTDVDKMTLTPVMMIQRDMTGKSILIKDKGSYMQQTDREEDVAAFVEALGLDPMSKGYCRMLFDDTPKGTVAYIVPGYTEEQWDSIEEDDGSIGLEDVPPGTLSIVAERIRQLVDEDWSLEHDMQYTQGELLAAAMNYLDAARLEIITGKPYKAEPPLHETVPWPWDMKWWKPDGVKRNIEKGGALVCAMADLGYLNAQMKATEGLAESLAEGNVGGLLGALLMAASQPGGPQVQVLGPFVIGGEEPEGDPKA